jgi:hypothetical protein
MMSGAAGYVQYSTPGTAFGTAFAGLQPHSILEAMDFIVIFCLPRRTTRCPSKVACAEDDEPIGVARDDRGSSYDPRLGNPRIPAEGKEGGERDSPPAPASGRCRRSQSPADPLQAAPGLGETDLSSFFHLFPQQRRHL